MPWCPRSLARSVQVLEQELRATKQKLVQCIRLTSGAGVDAVDPPQPLGLNASFSSYGSASGAASLRGFGGAGSLGGAGGGASLSSSVGSSGFRMLRERDPPPGMSHADMVALASVPAPPPSQVHVDEWRGARRV